MHQRGKPLWRAGTVMALACWLLAPGLRASVQDRREGMASATRQYKAQHFPDGNMPPKHGWNRQEPLQPNASTLPETPGGVGFGYYYTSSALLWTNATIADYYVIAPTYLGGDVSTLYLTSTCRAQLGTESLIEYDNENEAQFWIFDWSQATTPNPWQIMVDLPTDNPQYLTMRPDEFAVERQMVHVRNGTWYLGFSGGQYNWENRVMLFDFARGDWDLVYSCNYSTLALLDNLTVAGETSGFWGPIVETFESYTNVNPVGFDLVGLFQDGNANPTWLTPNNSYVKESSPWVLLTEASNTSFTVSVGSTNQSGESTNMGTLSVMEDLNTASFSLNPPAGLISPYWIIIPNSNRWDKTIVGLPPGAYTITFNAVAGLPTPAPQVFNIISNSITTVQATYGATNFPPVGDSPISVTGYNMDVVVPNTASGGNTQPYATPFDEVNSYGFFEAGLNVDNLSAINQGLPANGAFTSILDGVTTFQLGPYDGNNVLLLSQSSPTGSLTLLTPQAYSSLSVLASSANGGGPGTLVIQFADGTSSSPIAYNASDWLNNLGAAITRFGRLYFGDFGLFLANSPPGDNPNLYQTTINLAALGLAAKPITSVAFTMAGGEDASTNTDTGVFALSGTAAPPAFQSVAQTGNGIQFTWSAVAPQAYQLQYTTNLAQPNWVNLGAVTVATNYLAVSSDAIAADPARFYRVILLP